MNDSFVKKKNVTNEVREFIEYFGTHILRDSYSQMESEGFDVSAAASYSGFGFSVGAEFSMSSKQQSASSRFNEEVETYTTSVGSAVPQDGDAMTWASTVKDNPVPMGIQLIPISNVLKPQYTGEVFDQGFVDKFTEVLGGYCDYLKANGELAPDETCN